MVLPSILPLPCDHCLPLKSAAKMPDFCAAFGCSNKRTVQTRQKGITFHRFPKDTVLGKAWATALRRKDFKLGGRKMVCSCHFKPEDFDRTGQTVRLREGVIPSVFPAFPDHLKKETKVRTTKTSQAAVAVANDDPVPEPPEAQSTSSLDHQYALEPDQMKQKLIEAQARAEELQKQLNNAKKREQRFKKTVQSTSPKCTPSNCKVAARERRTHRNCSVSGILMYLV